ncbi:MAG: 50S ribosomal protein L11 methyltransferase [Variibacter sp.]
MSTATRLLRLTTNAEICARAQAILEGVLDAEHTALATSIGVKGRHVLEVYFDVPPNEDALRATLAPFTRDAAALTFEDVPTKDWVAASLAGLAPVHAGRFVVHGAHDRARVAPNAIGIEIEAALAFGTGHHGTTHGCLQALAMLAKNELAHRRKKPGASENIRQDERRVLDVGTGTAVLAIAAAKALRADVVASDIDPVALRVARANARANSVAHRIAFVGASGVSRAPFRARGPYDLIFANILLGPLKGMASPLARLLAPGGHIVLSGLLHEHANAALAAYRAHGLRLRRRLPVSEWTTLVLSRD